MIKARFEYTEDKKALILNVTGRYNDIADAEDITLSASTSILIYTLAQIVKDMDESKKLKKKPTITIKDDCASIVCKPRKDVYMEVLHSYYVAEVGFRLLSANYPNTVQLIPFER